MYCGRRGFTLIEVLLVSVLLSVVALAVFKAFSDGVGLWKRVNVELSDEDLEIFFSDVAIRLASAFRHGTVRFEGERERIAECGTRSAARRTSWTASTTRSAWRRRTTAGRARIDPARCAVC